jgi:hypothetical protein
MQQIRLFLFSTALLLALFGMTTLAGVSRAWAQTLPAPIAGHVTQSSLPQVTCSGNGCNGLNPVTAGCAADARVVQTVVVSKASVELRYSPRCGTKWGWVMSKVGPAYLVARIQRMDGLTYTFAGGQFTFAWSAMVYAPRTKARACGGVNGITGCTAYL